jgi:hypothetical protein
VSPPPKKTADYVDSVCVAIYGVRLMAMTFRGGYPSCRRIATAGEP